MMMEMGNLLECHRDDVEVAIQVFPADDLPYHDELVLDDLLDDDENLLVITTKAM